MSIKPDSFRGKQQWEQVTEQLGDHGKTLGQLWSQYLKDTPQQLAWVLSRYKFAAKMIGRHKNILELECGEGIGACILREFALSYTGVDQNILAIQSARDNWANERCLFVKGHFEEQYYGEFDSIICMNTDKYLPLEQQALFLKTLVLNLTPDGLCILGGTVHRQIEKQPLQNILESLFHHVFLFGADEDRVYTYHPHHSSFLLGLGCYRKLNHV